MPNVTGMSYTTIEGAKAVWGFFWSDLRNTWVKEREDVDTIQMTTRPSPEGVPNDSNYMWADLIIVFADGWFMRVTPAQMAREMTAIASDPEHECYGRALGQFLRDGESWLNEGVQALVLDSLVDGEVSA